MNINFSKASRTDLPHIVRLLADDVLGSQREKYMDPLPESYYTAFDQINNDRNQFLVAVKLDDKIIGTMQLTYIPYLGYQGGKVMIIESVRVDKSLRRKGIGKAMFEWAIQEAKQKDCHRVQLATDKQRPEAHEFYYSLGFVASHEGMKLFL